MTNISSNQLQPWHFFSSDGNRSDQWHFNHSHAIRVQKIQQMNEAPETRDEMKQGGWGHGWTSENERIGASHRRLDQPSSQTLTLLQDEIRQLRLEKEALISMLKEKDSEIQSLKEAAKKKETEKEDTSSSHTRRSDSQSRRSRTFSKDKPLAPPRRTLTRKPSVFRHQQDGATNLRYSRKSVRPVSTGNKTEQWEAINENEADESPRARSSSAAVPRRRTAPIHAISDLTWEAGELGWAETAISRSSNTPQEEEIVFLPRDTDSYCSRNLGEQHPPDAVSRTQSAASQPRQVVFSPRDTDSFWSRDVSKHHPSEIMSRNKKPATRRQHHINHNNNDCAFNINGQIEQIEIDFSCFRSADVAHRECEQARRVEV